MPADGMALPMKFGDLGTPPGAALLVEPTKQSISPAEGPG